MSKITSSLVKALRERTGAGVLECKKALVKAKGDIELAIDDMRKLGQAKVAKKTNRVATEGVIMAEVSFNSNFGALLELNCETDFVAKSADFIAFGNKVLKTVMANKLSNINELKEKFEEQRTAIIVKVGENINIRRIEILKGEKIGYYLHGTRIGALVSAESIDDSNNEFIKHIAMHIVASKPKYVTSADIPFDIIAREREVQLGIVMRSGKPYEIAEKIVTGRMNKFINEISLINQQFIMYPNKTVGALLKEKNIKITNFICFELGEGIKRLKSRFAGDSLVRGER